jgi:uncharacterized protein (TIGR03435 family)
VKPAAVPDGVRLLENGGIGVRKGSGIPIPRNTGGPGTDSPGRIHWPLISLKQLLTRAWESYYEIDGPGWLDSQTVAIDATMPPDTTKAQFQEMLRNLIAERFGLQYHAGKKEIAGYTLVIARNGPKLKESADQGEAEYARPPRPTSSDQYGFPIIPSFAGKTMGIERVRAGTRIVAQQMPIQSLADSLGSQLKTIVTDATGLTAKYDFTLTFANLQPVPPPANIPEGLEPLPDLFGALQSQLGLRLERKAVPIEIFVVDHMEKTPTGN